MRYDQNFIEKVRESNNIVDIISQYTDLKARGHNHMGLCPFPDHKEKSPSFSVSESKQLYHCFGCKKSGNLFTFLETYNGYSFAESVEFLANRAHIEIPKPVETHPGASLAQLDHKKQMHRANKFAAVFYHQKLKSLLKDHKVVSYLQKRKLSVEIIDEFKLGYAGEAWDDLEKYFKQKRVPPTIAQKLGLIRQNKNGGFFDLFRDRLMFPIFSIDGQVIGFGGRIIDQGQPKYLNSVESDVFKKGQSFYGLDLSAKHIRSEDRVFVVEGYMDLLALYSHGVRNVVATLGTALTDKHVHTIKRLTKNVVLLFDGDQAGQTAADRSLIHFLAQDLLPQIFILPEGMDPDDFINQHGKDHFLETSRKAEDLFLKLLSDWLRDYQATPREKIQIIDQVTPLLNALSDSRLLQIYIDELSKRLNEDPKTLFSWIVNGKKVTTQPQMLHSVENSVVMDKISMDGVGQDELGLLALSLKSLKFMNFFIEHRGLDFLSHNELKDIFTTVVTKYGQEPDNFDKLPHLVVSRVKNPEKFVNLINISSGSEATDQDENMLKECFIQVKDRYLQRQASVLVTQMKNDPSDAKLERFVNIQNDRKALKELKNTPLGE